MLLGAPRYNTVLKACAKAGNADAAAAVFARMRARGVRLNAKTSAGCRALAAAGSSARPRVWNRWPPFFFW